MGTIERRTRGDGSTSYRAKVRRRGHPALTKTFRRRSDAATWLRETERAIDAGLYGHDESRRRTFGDLMLRWIGDGCPTLQPRRGELAPIDVRRRVAQLEWWSSRIGDHFLAGVTLALIEDGVRALANGETPSGKPAGPATRNRYLAAVSALLSYGVRIRWISDHPIKGRISRAVEPEPDPRFFRRPADAEDPAEAEWPRIKAACAESEDRRLYPALLLAAVSGARPAELWLMPGAKTLPLRWDRLDLQRGVGRLATSKGGFARVLLIEGDALEAMRVYAKVRPLSAVYVFEDAKGSAEFPRRAWDQVRKAAGVDLTWQKLRHTAASWALMSGDTSLAAIGAYMGHRSAQTTQRYAHLAEQRGRSIAKVTARDL